MTGITGKKLFAITLNGTLTLTRTYRLMVPVKHSELGRTVSAISVHWIVMFEAVRPGTNLACVATTAWVSAPEP